MSVRRCSAKGQTKFRLVVRPLCAPCDLVEATNKHIINLHIHHKNFIMAHCDELFPGWLNFVSGVVDSNDFPLYSWREHLYRSKILLVIRKRRVQVCLDMFAEIAKKEFDCKKCHSEFGRWLTLGIHEEPTNRVNVAELLRYNTSDGDEQIRLAECTARKEGQTHIYYITGKSKAVASSSPAWASRAGRA